MKVCKVCGFDNPDVNVDCMKCGIGLELSIEQAQNLREMADKMTDTSMHDDAEVMRNSWQEAMVHRFDWLWNIGKTIERYKFRFQAVLLLLLIIGAGVLFVWIFSSFG